MSLRDSAVRSGAFGGGSVQKGADLMYDTMKKLEAQS